MWFGGERLFCAVSLCESDQNEGSIQKFKIPNIPKRKWAIITVYPRSTERKHNKIINRILSFVTVQLLAQITPHALHQCIDLVHQHRHAVSHNHRVWEHFK
jgi:hypothetical protein